MRTKLQNILKALTMGRKGGFYAVRTGRRTGIFRTWYYSTFIFNILTWILEMQTKAKLDARRSIVFHDRTSSWYIKDALFPTGEENILNGLVYTMLTFNADC